MSIEFQISKPVLTWIADMQAKDVSTLAQEFVSDEKKIENFLNGLVTKTQALKLAKLAKIPFGFLFLDKPPVITRPTLPDFRNTLVAEPLSNDFYEVLDDINNKIDWYKNFLKEEDILDKLDFVGRFDYKKSTAEYVAKDIAASIGYNIHTGLSKINHKNTYFSELVSKFENIGILIFQNSIVKNNTKKTLSVKEFRGFAITDKYAPAIFINSKDEKSAQLFTLLHEVAHLWIGQEGVSDWFSKNKLETFCNKVAAHFFMPDDMFKSEWQKKADIFTDKLDIINEISKFFKVSSLAIAIKAVHLNFIPNDYINTIRKQIDKQLLKNQSKDRGGNPYASYPLRNSKRLTKIILTQTLNQHILITDAAKLLNLKPTTVMNLYGTMQDKI
jgi:Zn-dependent peptidase ImmA (M78 family)